MKKISMYFITVAILSFPISILASDPPKPSASVKTNILVNLANIARIAFNNLEQQKIAASEIFARIDKQDKIYAFVDKNYTEIYLELMKNSDTKQGPVLWGGNLEIAAIANKYKIMIEVVNLDENDGKEIMSVTIGEEGPKVMIINKNRHYKCVDSFGKEVDVPRDGNCLFNAILEVAKINNLTQIIPQDVTALRKEVVEYLTSNPGTAEDLSDMRVAGETNKIDGVNTLEEIVNHFLMDEMTVSSPMFKPIIIMALRKNSVENVHQEDFNVVLEFIRQAAELGNSYAQCGLGFYYSKGLGVVQSDENAFMWYEKAAKQGNARAQCNLGVCCLNGRGVAQSDKEAIMWFTKAAEQGDGMAQYNLGAYYEMRCDGLRESMIAAIKWYKKSSESGYAEAQKKMVDLYDSGRLIYFVEDQEEIFKKYIKDAELGNVNAQKNIGVCYEKGLVVDVNDEEAVKWYTKAADQGSLEAKKGLDFLYRQGRLIVVVKNKEEIFERYKKDAQGIYPDPFQYNLGVCYDQGIGVKQDYKEAVYWYSKAELLGNELAMYKLAVCYELGHGVDQDFKQAFSLYKEAATNFYAEALPKFKLGLCYEQGIGVNPDSKKAMKWYKKAAKLGSIEAQNKLNIYTQERDSFDDTSDDSSGSSSGSGSESDY